MTLRVRPEAVTDIAEAALWYQARQAELGAAFVDEVDAAFACIERGQLCCAAVHGRFAARWCAAFPTRSISTWIAVTLSCSRFYISAVTGAF